MPRLLRYLVLALLVLTLFPAQADAQTPVVHAVLFYSPTCPHCQKVLEEDLPPILEKYGDSLLMIGVNVTQVDGQILYQAAVQALGIPEERRAVPALVIGDVVLVGSDEIPAQFPGLIDAGLAQGGIDWPAIPGIAPILESVGISATPAPPETIAQRFQHDPVANSVAVGVLVLLVIALIFSVVRVILNRPAAHAEAVHWSVPVLAIAGLGISLYLAYLESTGVRGVCGPIGDCNAVQQSTYARLGGVLPVAFLGVAGTLAELAAWLTGRIGSGTVRRVALIALFAMGIVGVGFSIYLTALEPFVIGATCAWCLTSALLQAAILVLVSGPAALALHPRPPAEVPTEAPTEAM